LEWTRYVLLKRMGSLSGLNKENQIEFWSSSSLVMYLYKIKCIYDIVCIVIYNQNVKVIHFEGWKKTNCIVATKVTKNHVKLKCSCTCNHLNCMRQPIASSCKWVGCKQHDFFLVLLNDLMKCDLEWLWMDELIVCHNIWIAKVASFRFVKWCWW
jgi:hypothetical protein